MSTSGETADLMVKEGIQITESAVKLAGLGAKNLAALLIALANDNQTLLPIGDGLDGYGVAGGVQLNPAAVCGDKALDAQHVAVPGIV